LNQTHFDVDAPTNVLPLDFLLNVDALPPTLLSDVEEVLLNTLPSDADVGAPLDALSSDTPMLF